MYYQAIKAQSGIKILQSLASGFASNFYYFFVFYAGVVNKTVIIHRALWNARTPRKTPVHVRGPVSTVIIHHTMTSRCMTQLECEKIVNNIQARGMNSDTESSEFKYTCRLFSIILILI